MSYNGSGTFVVNSAGQPVVTGTVISSTAFNALTADLATGLSTAITKDGQTTTTVRVPFAAGISSTLVTDATSALTGSIITAGGISTQKALWVGTTSRLVGNVQADGLVGIGMTPTNVLDITQSANANSIGRIFNGTSGTAGSAEWRASNNVNDSIRMISLNQSYTTSGVFAARKSVIASDGVGLAITTMSAQAVQFGINNVEVARFGTDGSFLVGTTTNAGAGAIATNVAAASYINTAVRNAANTAIVFLPSAGANTRQWCISTELLALGDFGITCSTNNAPANNSTDQPTRLYMTRTGALTLSAYGAGTATFDGSGNITSSDIRIKYDVAEFVTPTGVLEAITPKTFKLISERDNVAVTFDKDGKKTSTPTPIDDTHIGFIANDIQSILPDAVDWSNTEDEILNYSDRALIAVLWNETKALKTRLAALENK